MQLSMIICLLTASSLLQANTLTESASFPYIFLSMILFILFVAQSYRYSRLKHTMGAATPENSEQKIQHEIEKCRQREEQILQHSRLAQMGEMISMIAHQWRQPLGAIASTAIGIETKIHLRKFDYSTPQGSADVEKYLLERTELIAKYVNTLTTTIDDFRNFYQKDKAKEETAIEPLILKALGIIRGAMEQKGVLLTVQVDSHSSAVLFPNEMVQVLLNILQNAYDQFSDTEMPNPSITITASDIDGFIRIEISDNAGGISEEILPKIFHPYFSTKRQKNGTGIGLYMGKIIVEDHHNGLLSAANNSHGASFTIQIPIADKEKREI